MVKQVHNKVVGNALYDGDMLVEDVVSVGIPKVAYKTDEYDVTGMSSAIEVTNPNQTEAMTFSITHNNGNNCHVLAEPRRHKFEFRIAQQVLTTATGETDYKSVKYRVEGYPKNIDDGTVEKDNPIGATNEYTVLRYEKEIAGRRVLLIDALSGEIEVNGKSYSGKINSLLY